MGYEQANGVIFLANAESSHLLRIFSLIKNKSYLHMLLRLLRQLFFKSLLLFLPGSHHLQIGPLHLQTCKVNSKTLQFYSKLECRYSLLQLVRSRTSSLSQGNEPGSPPSPTWSAHRRAYPTGKASQLSQR